MSAVRPAPVSVVIPVYNRLATLRQAVASVQSQLLPPSEVVIVDDGSTDGDVQASLQRDPVPGPVPVRVIRQANGGPSRARNTGVRASTGRWVAFLDADDLWLPDRLARQWPLTERFPDAVLISADWVRPWAVGRRPLRTPPPRRWTSEHAVRRILWLNRFQTSTVLARRDALLAAGLFDPAMDGFEDWDLWTRTAAQGAVIHLPFPLVVYTDTPGGVSKDTARAYERGLVLLQRYRRGEGDPHVARWVTPHLLTWHHLRYAFAFARLGERQRSTQCLAQAFAPGSRLLGVRVAVCDLLPFLVARRLRRNR